MTWGRGSTRAWRTLRAKILKRDPLCQLNLPGCTGRSTEVDHIISVAEGGTDQPSNLRGVCHNCHAKRTKAQATRGRARTRPSRTRPPENHPGMSHMTYPPR